MYDTNGNRTNNENARKVNEKSSKGIEVEFNYLDHSRWLTHTLVSFQVPIRRWSLAEESGAALRGWGITNRHGGEVRRCVEKFVSFLPESVRGSCGRAWL